VQKEAQLKQLEAELKEHAAEEKEKRLTLRYRAVRFFEKRKIIRKIQSLKKKLNQIHSTSKGRTSEEASLRKELDALEEDLQYVVHFPRGMKYVSLFANNDHRDDPSVIQKREEIRTLIKRQLASGTKQLHTGQTRDDKDDGDEPQRGVSAASGRDQERHRLDDEFLLEDDLAEEDKEALDQESDDAEDWPMRSNRDAMRSKAEMEHDLVSDTEEPTPRLVAKKRPLEAHDEAPTSKVSVAQRHSKRAQNAHLQEAKRTKKQRI